MAYDEGLVERLREVFEDTDGVTEKKMFGGVAFMVRGNMVCGVGKDDLMLRVGKEQYEAVLKRDGVKPMDFTGRPMQSFVTLLPEAYESDEDLESWIELAMAFVDTLPAK